jgi:hypothetical protein
MATLRPNVRGVNAQDPTTTPISTTAATQPATDPSRRGYASRIAAFRAASRSPAGLVVIGIIEERGDVDRFLNERNNEFPL